MLELVIPQQELWDEQNNEFIKVDETHLQLEHSLVSISKWESRWKKPFLLKNGEKTLEETLDYIKCMTLNDVDPVVYTALTQDDVNKISAYIEDPMSATWFNDRNQRPSREIITSEKIYYWMTAAQIPFECQYWHLNRLMTLIRICSIESQPKKKMSRNDIYNQNRALNEARRAKMKSKG